MIVIRGKAADAIREARCTGCWPEGINEGILFIPETLDLPVDEEEDDGGIDHFVEALIESMSKPITGDGKWFPTEPVTGWHNEVFKELGWYNSEEDEEDAPELEPPYKKGCSVCGTFTGIHKFSWEK